MINLKPLKKLIEKHRKHRGKYKIIFRDTELTIYPSVLNPNYTKVSGFLSDNVYIPEGSDVLDMFCGSGAIGLVNANKVKSLLGVDISKDAVNCSRENANNLGIKNAAYRLGDLWDVVKQNEKFDIILANPPLLPITPHTKFESSFADSPEMKLSKSFVKGCKIHLRESGCAYISNSSASDFLNEKKEKVNVVIDLAIKLGLKTEVISELDAGYEIYRVIKISKN